MKKGGRRLIGLTGGIATGKSTAARYLSEAGTRVIDADALARKVVEPGRPALAQIRSAFGRDVLRPDGSLDRIVLGKRIFSDPEARARLNAIMHPRIEEEARREMETIWAEDPTALVFYDVPLLFEAGMVGRFESVVVVYSTREEQVRRLVSRDGTTVAEAEARIRSQMDIEEKVRRAHFVLNNMGSATDLKAQVLDLLKRLKEVGEK